MGGGGGGGGGGVMGGAGEGEKIKGLWCPFGVKRQSY